jgi:hypothetical protein
MISVDEAARLTNIGKGKGVEEWGEKMKDFLDIVNNSIEAAAMKGSDYVHVLPSYVADFSDRDFTFLKIMLPGYSVKWDGDNKLEICWSEDDFDDEE